MDPLAGGELQPTSASRRPRPVLPPILPPAPSGFASSHASNSPNSNRQRTARPADRDVKGGSPGSPERSDGSGAAGGSPAGPAPAPAPMYYSPNSLSASASVAALSTRMAVADGKGLGATETALLEGHVTNTRATVNVVQLNFNDAMRGYRVYGQDYSVRPILRLLGASDLVLLALAVSFLLSCVASVGGGLADGDDMPSFNRSDAAAQRALLENSFSVKLHMILCGACFFVLAVRLVSALGRTYIEEVIAIRGMGLLLTEYGVFNQVRSRRFIDLKLIRSLVIHDAFFRYQPIFFLSASVENEPRRVVFFSETLPKLACLRLVLRGLRHVLYGEEELGPSLADIQQELGPRGLQRIPFEDDALTRSDESGLEDGGAASGSAHSSPQTPTQEREYDSLSLP